MQIIEIPADPIVFPEDGLSADEAAKMLEGLPKGSRSVEVK